MTQIQKLDALIRNLGVAEVRMKKGVHVGLTLSLLFGLSTSRALRSWYWEPVRRDLAGKDLQQMWANSERGDWLLWFCTHLMGHTGWPTHQQVVLASCQCARLAMKYVPPAERRPLIAIQAAEAWARGEATSDQVRHAGHAADRVTLDGNIQYLAAQAAYSAAWAVYATEDGSCFRLAQATSGTARRAASAAGYELFAARLEAHEFGPAAQAASKEGEKNTLAQCADIVRRSLTIPRVLTDELQSGRRKSAF